MSKKHVVTAAAVLALAAGGVSIARSDEAQAGAPGPARGGAVPPAPEVMTSEVVIRSLAETADFTGTLTAVESVELRPRIGGYIQSVHLPEGGLVKRGQLLFQIDPRPFQAALARAQADFKQAEERHALAQLRYERGAKLVAERALSQSEFDALASERVETLAKVEAARATVRAAELDLEYTRVRSPIDGRAGLALVTEGNLVAGGGAGATLLTSLVSVDPLHVSFDIDEPTYLRLSRSRAAARDADGRMEGVPVHVGLANESDFPREARLDFLSNRVDPTTGTARARATLSNPEGRLSPGLFARVRLELAEPREAVLINDQAVGTDQQGRFVLVVTPDNRVEQRRVRLGGVVDGLRVVREGLRPGERILVKGQARPGMTVSPRAVAMVQAARPAAEGGEVRP
jgi:gold/copper resistance efflux system membrane fusion protein